MVDVLRKLLLAGLGTLDLTEEKVRSVFNDLVARGEMSDNEARELLSTWARRAGEQRERVQRQIEEGIHRALDAAGLVRRADFDALAARVAEIEKQMPPGPRAS